VVNIILQHFDGELRELDYLSIANIKQYAKMVGAEYKLIKVNLLIKILLLLVKKFI
jgi:hypothetical protein